MSSNTYRQGQIAPYGFYVSRRPLDVVHISIEGERIEGPADAQYRRVPSGVMLLAAPVFGGAFVLLFPLLVLAGVVVGLGAAVRPAFARLWNAGHVAAPRWEPAASFLNRESEDAEAEAGVAAELSDLEPAVAEQRLAEGRHLAEGKEEAK